MGGLAPLSLDAGRGLRVANGSPAHGIGPPLGRGSAIAATSCGVYAAAILGALQAFEANDAPAVSLTAAGSAILPAGLLASGGQPGRYRGGVSGTGRTAALEAGRAARCGAVRSCRRGRHARAGIARMRHRSRRARRSPPSRSPSRRTRQERTARAASTARSGPD